MQRTPKLRLKFEGERRASSPSIFAFLRAVPWAHEANKLLSRLALIGCELSADVRIFRAALSEASGTDHLSYV